jgi:hypothetical protein
MAEAMFGKKSGKPYLLAISSQDTGSDCPPEAGE